MHTVITHYKIVFIHMNAWHSGTQKSSATIMYVKANFIVGQLYYCFGDVGKSLRLVYLLTVLNLYDAHLL